MSKKDIVKILLISTLYVGMLTLIHFRINQVERARCETWQWEVCAEVGGK